ncbi:MAG: hypothetical protein LUG57_02325 [Oscillospiraceae bacterium]|nr:hypothetical protein [Oscillospiraceae bacterium]
MSTENIDTRAADTEWHYRQDSESRIFYRIFFRMCRKYNVSYASATPEQKYFVEEVARLEYERDRAKRLGLPLSSIRPAFEAGPDDDCYHPSNHT